MDIIGLRAILGDEQFHQGVQNFDKGVAQMQRASESGASAMSKIWSVGSIAVATGAAAVVAGIAGIVAVSKTGLDSLTEWNDQVNTLSDNLGTTGEESSKWATAFQHVGLSVEEGGAGLNFFVKNLDNLKNAIPAVTTTTTKLSAEALAGLNQRLDDANVRLERAQKVLREAKTPTDSMRYAVDDAQKAIGRLNDEIAGGKGLVTSVKGAAAAISPFQAALKTLGVNAFDAHGKLKTFDQLMPSILDSFQKMPAGVQKTALAMDLFGARAGTKFLDFLSQGSEGLEKARQMAELYGLTLDTDLSNAVEAFGFAMNDLNLAAKGFWVIIGKAVLPIAVKFITLINDKFVPPLLRFAKFVAPLLADVLDRTVNIFSDFLALLSGENKLPQIAKQVGDLAAVFGLSGKAVTQFILDVGGFLQKAITNIQSFIGRIANMFEFFQAAIPLGSKFGVVVYHIANALGVSTEKANDLWRAVSSLVSAFQAGDWGKVAGIIGDGLRGVGDVIVKVVAEWGPKVWGWIVDAGALAGGKINEFVGGVGTFLAKNGPTTWAALTQWGTDFWGWLSGPNGALAQVSSQLFILGTSLATWIGATWTSTVQPALDLWGGKFWSWITDPKTGVISQAADQILSISTAMKAAADSPAAKEELRLSGKNMTVSLLTSIGDFINSADGKVETDNVFLKLYGALNQAAINNKAAGETAGRETAKGIWDGIVKYWNDNLLSNQMYDWLNKSADALLLNLNELAAKISRGVIEAINKAMLDLHINLPLIGLPGLPPPITQSPITQPVTQSGGLGVGGGIGSLTVHAYIDSTETKNVVFKAVFDDVAAVFNGATAAVTAGAVQ